jgi:hypothetical protein
MNAHDQDLLIKMRELLQQNFKLLAANRALLNDLATLLDASEKPAEQEISDFIRSNGLLIENQQSNRND